MPQVSCTILIGQSCASIPPDADLRLVLDPFLPSLSAIKLDYILPTRHWSIQCTVTACQRLPRPLLFIFPQGGYFVFEPSMDRQRQWCETETSGLRGSTKPCSHILLVRVFHRLNNHTSIFGPEDNRRFAIVMRSLPHSRIHYEIYRFPSKGPQHYVCYL